MGSLRFIRSARVADAVAVGPLEARGQALSEAAINGGLERIVMVGAAAGLVVDLGELAAVLENRRARCRIYSDDPVGPGAEEQIASLAADVSHREDSAARQLLLDRRGVRQDFFGNFVLIRRVCARLITGVIGRGESGQHLRRNDRVGDAAAGESGARAIGIDRLDLVFSLARSIKVARADPEDRPVLEHFGGPRKGQARTEVGLRALIPLRGVGHDLAGGRVEQDEQIAIFVERLVILVAQAVAHGEVGADLPLVLRVTDQVILLDEAIAGSAAIERIGRAGVAQHLDLAGRVREKRVEVGEGVSGAAQAVGVEADGPELESELHGVIVVDDTEVVDKRQRIARVRLSSSVLGTVGTDQVAKRGCSRRRTLSSNSGDRDCAGVADGKGAGVDSGNGRREARDARL